MNIGEVLLYGNHKWTLANSRLYSGRGSSFINPNWYYVIFVWRKWCWLILGSPQNCSHHPNRCKCWVWAAKASSLCHRFLPIIFIVMAVPYRPWDLRIAVIAWCLPFNWAYRRCSFTVNGICKPLAHGNTRQNLEIFVLELSRQGLRDDVRTIGIC